MGDERVAGGVIGNARQNNLESFGMRTVRRHVVRQCTASPIQAMPYGVSLAVCYCCSMDGVILVLFPPLPFGGRWTSCVNHWCHKDAKLPRFDQAVSRRWDPTNL